MLLMLTSCAYPPIASNTHFTPASWSELVQHVDRLRSDKFVSGLQSQLSTPVAPCPPPVDLQSKHDACEYEGRMPLSASASPLHRIMLGGFDPTDEDRDYVAVAVEDETGGFVEGAKLEGLSVSARQRILSPRERI